MRDYVKKNTDPDTRVTDVIGYLLCGDLVDTPYEEAGKTIWRNRGFM